MTATVHFPVHPGKTVDPADLEPSEIHLWSARLDVSTERVAALASVLSDDERQRAQRYRLARHRRRFEVGWGLTRALLGSYLGETPRGIELRYGPKGKPALSRPDTDLAFNLAHSGEHLVVAVGRGQRLGVDIERSRPVHEARSIAHRFFSRQETERLEALSDADYMHGFFRCWTRKEALIKAVGEGVFVSLDRFDVSLAPGEPARLLALDGRADGVDDWSLFHLEPAPGVLGALATDDPPPAAPRAWTMNAEEQSLPGID